MWEEENTNVGYWKCIWNEKTNNLKSNLVCKQTAISKPHDNHTPKSQNTHREHKKESKPNSKVSHQITREHKREEKKSYRNKSPILNKVAIRKHRSIIFLSVNVLNAPTKRHRLVEWIQKQDPYIYCLQDLGTQMDWKQMGKGIPCRWKSKESWSSDIHIRQNRL